MDEINCRIKLTSADLAMAEKAMETGKNLKQLVISLIISLAVLSGFLGVGLWKLYQIFQDGFSKAQLTRLWDEPISLCTLLTIITVPPVLIWVYKKRRQAREIFDKESTEFTCRINNRKITFEEQNGILSIPWKDFIDRKETPELFLFYETDYRTRFLPKRFLSPEETEQVRKWFQELPEEQETAKFQLDAADDENAIKCKGRISFEEFASTRKDFYKLQKFLVAGLGILLLLLIGMGAIGRMFPEQVQSFNNGHPVDFDAPYMETSRFIIFFIFIVLYYFLLVFVRKKEKRSFESDKFNHEDCEYSLAPEYIASSSSRGKVRICWKDFIRWSENSQTFTFFRQTGPYVIFPKRLLTKNEQQQVREWLKSAIKP